MSPFRWDVIVVGLLLSVPVLALGLRGDFTAEEVAERVLWCLAAGWGVVTLLRFATAPTAPSPAQEAEPQPDAVATESESTTA